MSRKVVAFTLPSMPHGPARSQPQRQEADRWVSGPAPSTASTHPVVIDLSASRSWFELAQLIWAFPYIATWCWMQNAFRAAPPPPADSP
jgi:hypothetical protein